MHSGEFASFIYAHLHIATGLVSCSDAFFICLSLMFESERMLAAVSESARARVYTLAAMNQRISRRRRQLYQHNLYKEETGRTIVDIW